jgi:hypothetical protein
MPIPLASLAAARARRDRRVGSWHACPARGASLTTGGAARDTSQAEDGGQVWAAARPCAPEGAAVDACRRAELP